MERFKPFSLNLHGRLLECNRPQVMGIINVTPDSFFAGSRTVDSDDIEARAAKMIDEGADMLDIGGYSSRPGADDVPPEVEKERIATGIKAIRRVSPSIPVSVDTFRADVAEYAVSECGADIVNDISGGDLDPNMFGTVARLKAPYILMHMCGTPASMSTMTDYVNVTAEVIARLTEKVDELSLLGVADVIVDPGFGFAKTLEQNYELLKNLSLFTDVLHKPLLVGMSRKSMITRALGIDASQALNGTTVVNTIALMEGAAILRVHDVRQAAEAVKLCGLTAGGADSITL